MVTAGSLKEDDRDLTRPWDWFMTRSNTKPEVEVVAALIGEEVGKEYPGLESFDWEGTARFRWGTH